VPDCDDATTIRIRPLRRIRDVVGDITKERDAEDLQGFSQGMPTTQAEKINADILAFIQGGPDKQAD